MTLTIHHLQVSQSERIVWLAEELGIPYTLQLHQRDPIFSPQSIKDLHPLEQAPIFQDGPLTLAESGAVVEYIIHKHGHGKFALPPSHPNYAQYLYWFHFANGNIQPALLRLLTAQSSSAESGGSVMARMNASIDKLLNYMDDNLKEKTWLAGDEFTAADCMTVFILTTMRCFVALDLSKYSHILAYLKRAADRDGYRRARAKADPELPFMIEGPAPTSFREMLRAQGKI